MNSWKIAILMMFAALSSAHAIEGPQSPINTVLKPSHVLAQAAPESVAGAMVRGFVACNPKSALPRDVLSPLGVRFLEAGRAARIRFSYPSLVGDRSAIVLLGNDPVNMETSGDGSYLVYGGKYRMKKMIKFGDAELRVVASMVTAYPPKAVVGVTYTFGASAKRAVAAMESVYGVRIATGGPAPKPEAAKAGAVWFTEGSDGKSLSCWRYLD